MSVTQEELLEYPPDKPLSVDDMVKLIKKHMPRLELELMLLVNEIRVINSYHTMNEMTLKHILVPKIENFIDYKLKPTDYEL